MFLADTWRQQSKFPETKFIFPNAPQIPITINMGMRMPGWYDITDFGDLANRSEDEEGIIRSQKVFHSLIAEEVKNGIDTERIVLGGFSQGGAMSLMSGITCPSKLGGIFGLSCYMLLQSKVQEMVPKDAPNQKTPIFMGHGDADPLVKVQWGEATAQKLRDWGYEVDFKTYRNLPHAAAQQEIDDLEEYLRKRIPDVEGK
jgi:predicted esterase